MIPDNDCVLETEGLNFAYNNSDTLSLDDVNIRISRTRKTAILGANGAGKSTLFYHFNGVLKPRNGTVLYDGKPISYDRGDLVDLRKEIVVVLQNPDEQIFSATVEEDVAFGALNSGFSHEETDKRIEDALFTVGMSEYRMRPTTQLSYGQKKRVALAGALAMGPKVLILDEPTAGLDPQMAQEVMELADQLHHSGVTVIISTHDVDLAYAWAEDMHVLRGGKVVYSGSSEGFYSNPLEISYSGLLAPSMFAINQNLTMLKGCSPEPYPRTRSELLSKMSPGGMSAGRLTIVAVGDTLTSEDVETIRAEAGSDSSAGLYGFDTRRLAYKSGSRFDYVFNGMENCLIEVLLGNSTVLFHDRFMTDFVKDEIKRIEGFGVELNVIERGV